MKDLIALSFRARTFLVQEHNELKDLADMWPLHADFIIQSA